MPTIAKCGVSDATELRSLWALPSLPLTERFGAYRPNQELSYDQDLVISVPTGHVQLRNQLDPRVLYTDAEYSFRTGASEKSRRGVEFFNDFLGQFTGGRRFRSVVDVGGNDLYLARVLAGSAEHTAVIDPICAAEDGQLTDGVLVLGRFIEEVDLGSDLPPPDLVVCRHTLEHVARPRDVIEQWFRQCRDDCLYVIEVPCFGNLVEAQRFDAIFHQHFHYFDLDSFRQLVWSCGGEHLGHAFNHQGSCGGALLVAFRKANSSQPEPVIDVRGRIDRFQRRIEQYRQQMALMREALRELPRPLFGYGAGLMLPTLAYHLKTDFRELECVLDDDVTKDGVGYENLPVEVRHPSKVDLRPNASYLITSLENIRSIHRRIQELQPRRILVPLIN